MNGDLEESIIYCWIKYTSLKHCLLENDYTLRNFNSNINKNLPFLQKILSIEYLKIFTEKLFDLKTENINNYSRKNSDEIINDNSIRANDKYIKNPKHICQFFLLFELFIEEYFSQYAFLEPSKKIKKFFLQFQKEGTSFNSLENKENILHFYKILFTINFTEEIIQSNSQANNLQVYELYAFYKSEQKKFFRNIISNPFLFTICLKIVNGVIENFTIKSGHFDLISFETLNKHFDKFYEENLMTTEISTQPRTNTNANNEFILTEEQEKNNMEFFRDFKNNDNFHKNDLHLNCEDKEILNEIEDENEKINDKIQEIFGDKTNSFREGEVLDNLKEEESIRLNLNNFFNTEEDKDKHKFKKQKNEDSDFSYEANVLTRINNKNNNFSEEELQNSYSKQRLNTYCCNYFLKKDKHSSNHSLDEIFKLKDKKFNNEESFLTESELLEEDLILDYNEIPVKEQIKSIIFSELPDKKSLRKCSSNINMNSEKKIFNHCGKDQEKNNSSIKSKKLNISSYSSLDEAEKSIKKFKNKIKEKVINYDSNCTYEIHLNNTKANDFNNSNFAKEQEIFLKLNEKSLLEDKMFFNKRYNSIKSQQSYSINCKISTINNRRNSTSWKQSEYEIFDSKSLNEPLNNYNYRQKDVPIIKKLDKLKKKSKFKSLSNAYSHEKHNISEKILELRNEIENRNLENKNLIDINKNLNKEIKSLNKKYKTLEKKIEYLQENLKLKEEKFKEMKINNEKIIEINNNIEEENKAFSEKITVLRESILNVNLLKKENEKLKMFINSKADSVFDSHITRNFTKNLDEENNYEISSIKNPKIKSNYIEDYKFLNSEKNMFSKSNFKTFSDNSEDDSSSSSENHLIIEEDEKNLTEELKCEIVHSKSEPKLSNMNSNNINSGDFKMTYRANYLKSFKNRKSLEFILSDVYEKFDDDINNNEILKKKFNEINKFKINGNLSIIQDQFAEEKQKEDYQHAFLENFDGNTNYFNEKNYELKNSLDIININYNKDQSVNLLEDTIIIKKLESQKENEQKKEIFIECVKVGPKLNKFFANMNKIENNIQIEILNLIDNLLPFYSLMKTQDFLCIEKVDSFEICEEKFKLDNKTIKKNWDNLKSNIKISKNFNIEFKRILKNNNFEIIKNEAIFLTINDNKNNKSLDIFAERLQIEGINVKFHSDKLFFNNTTNLVLEGSIGVKQNKKNEEYYKKSNDINNEIQNKFYKSFYNLIILILIILFSFSIVNISKI